MAKAVLGEPALPSLLVLLGALAGALGLGVAFGSAFVLQLLDGRASAATQALRLFGARGVGGAGVRVVLAANQFDLGDFGRIATTVAQLQQPRVTTRTLHESRCEGVEQLGDDLLVGHVA